MSDPGQGMSEPRVMSDEAYERVKAGVSHRIRRRRRRRDFLIGSVVGVVVAGALGGSVWVITAPQNIRDHDVWCYPTADLSSQPVQSERSPRDAVTDPAGYAVSVCGVLWKGGFVDPLTHEAPPLALCTQTDGTFAVFPRAAAEDPDKQCETLGLGHDPRK